MEDDPRDEFVLRIAFDQRSATVAVSGDIDAVSAPSLESALTTLITGDYSGIVVDLGDVTVLAPPGIDVLASATQLATSNGATLRLRAVPPEARQLLEIAPAGSLMNYEPARPQEGDDEEADGDSADASPAGPSSQPLLRSSTDVIDAALRLVTALAGATVDQADGVSVTLERHGRLMTVAATDDAVLTMDKHQYETGEGPCLDAKAQGRWFYTESLAQETRWPAFAPLALAQGINSVLSSPLMTRDRPQGALNIYSSTPRAFGEHEQELAALFAAQASEILTTADAGTTDEQADRRFADGLASRQIIHQAQGVLMTQRLQGAGDAMSMLLRDARTNNITLLAQAHAVLASLTTDETN